MLYTRCAYSVSIFFTDVNNLQSNDSVTYVDVHSGLLELSGSANLSGIGKALNTRSYKVHKCNNQKKNCEKPNPTGPGKAPPLNCNHYSHCQKHCHAYESHTYKFFNRLKSAQEGSSSSAAPPAPAREVVPYRANLTINEQYDHGVAFITSCLPHPVPTIPSGSAFQTANDKTYEIWIVGTGASFLITAAFSHFLVQMRCHVALCKWVWEKCL